jgi:gamma-glutamylcyclotransferase (GGCT)/AIG2-like uncharacterized protein YtfP
MTGQHWLFSYGTLRKREVQVEVFGRELESFDDAIPGFKIDRLRIADDAVVALSGSDSHPILRRGGSDEQVHGVVFVVSDDDLIKADSYEVSEYVRIVVTLSSGRRSFVYVHRDDQTGPSHEPHAT